jgi:site-specific DNA recombinase
MTRLPRNARDRLRLLETGKRHGITVAFVRGADLNLGTPAGRLTADILGSVAQHEIEQKSDRQRRAAVQAAEQGRWIGGRRPFGYEADGVTIREIEATAVREAYTAVLAGVPLGQIARDWNSAGFNTPQNTRDGKPSPWTSQALRTLLLNPRYTGLRSHVSGAQVAQPRRKARLASITGPAAWPALVPEEVWRATVETLNHPSRMSPPRSGKGLLTGVALCGVCGATVHRGASRHKYGMYRCSASTGHFGRASNPVDDHIGDVVIAWLGRVDAGELLRAAPTGPDAAKLREEAAALRARRDGLATLLADGVLTEMAVRREATRLAERLAQLEHDQADAGRVNVLGPLLAADDKREAWEALGTDRQRAVVDMLATVTLLPPGRGAREFKPETVVIDWKL